MNELKCGGADDDSIGNIQSPESFLSSQIVAVRLINYFSLRAVLLSSVPTLLSPS